MFFSKDLNSYTAYSECLRRQLYRLERVSLEFGWTAILAWIVAGIIIGLATISDYKKAELLKKWNKITGKGYRNKNECI